MPGRPERGVRTVLLHEFLVRSELSNPPEGLAEISTYANGIGAAKDLVLPRDSAGNATTPTHLVDKAHERGLLVHVWTMRDENRFMAENFRDGTDPNAKGDALAEYRAFFDAGVDGVFSDYADIAVEAIEIWRDEQVGQASGLRIPATR